MRSDRASGRLAERVARRKSEILAGITLHEPQSVPATVRVCPIEERSVHEIATLEVAGSSAVACYFAKATVPGYAGSQDLAAESRILADLGPRMAALNRKTRCPAVIAFFPEEKLLIEEFVRGQTLKALLFDFPPAHADLGRLLSLSGEWLANFHRSTQRGYANPLDWLWGEIHSRQLTDAFRRCSIPELYPVVVQLLRHFRQQYPNLYRPLCQVHGEFTPLHIMVQNEDLYVIDFGSSHRGFPCEDLARFSTFYEGLLPWRGAIALLRFPVARQINVFLESYAAHAGFLANLEDDVVNRFARLCAMAHQQLCWEREPRSYREKGPLKIRQIWTRRRFASLARRELTHLQQLADDDQGSTGLVSQFPVAIGADTPLSE
jgi:hypothetical protein